MESLGLLVLLFLAPLIVSIVVAAQFGKLKASIDDLRRRLLALEGRSSSRDSEPAPPKRAIPPPLPAFLQPPPIPASTSSPPSPGAKMPAPSFDWESIVGVKVFAWIGGLAFFLGVVFFVKYAFDNNLITPGMRIVAGGVVGIALVAIGAPECLCAGRLRRRAIG